MKKQKSQKICKHCGNSFYDPKHPNKKYCSRKCFRKDIKNPKMERRECIICGKFYNPYRTTQKYCSLKCFGQPLKKQYPSPICETCQKPFEYNPKSKNRFCSYGCMHNAPTTGIEVTCEICNKPFIVNLHRYQNSNSRFCSMECKSEAGKGWLTCEVCGKTVKVRKHIIEGGKYSGRFCSYVCAAIWQKSENHSNWKGGHEKWRGTNWIKQKNKARERDKYICQSCGTTEDKLGRPLDVHHIIPWRNFDNDYKKANQLDNLISYCPACHTTIERRR